MVVTLFATYLTKSLNVCLLYINPSHLEDLSVLGSIGETENERYLTGEMFNYVCRLFAILCGWGYFEGSADDIWAHLYDYFKGDLRCMPPTEDTLMQRALRAFKQITIGKSDILFQQNIPDNILIPTMLLKSAKPIVVTIIPPSASA